MFYILVPDNVGLMNHHPILHSYIGIIPGLALESWMLNFSVLCRPYLILSCGLAGLTRPVHTVCLVTIGRFVIGYGWLTMDL